MSKDDRLFAPFPIEMDEHPKIIGLSDAAFRAVIEATFYSRRMLSDGFLDERVVLRKWGQEVADELSTNDPERPSWIRMERGWQIHDFGKHHPLRAEIQAKRDAISELNSAKGKRSAEARRAKAERDVNRIEPSVNRNEPGVNRASTESNSETETETSKRRVQKPARYTPEFEEWWAVYPRKQAKKDAQKAFNDAVKDGATQKQLIAGAQAYALLNITEDKSFLKLPGGWLRGERWEDEQIVNATKRTVTDQPRECQLHPGYPKPCDKCEREGRNF